MSASLALVVILWQYEFRPAGKPAFDHVFADLVVHFGLALPEFNLEGLWLVLVIDPVGRDLAFDEVLVPGGANVHGMHRFLVRRVDEHRFLPESQPHRDGAAFLSYSGLSSFAQ